MKKFNKTVSALLLAATLICGASRASQAGIILLPAYGVGVILVIIGAVEHDLLLIILDADGNVSKDQLEKSLAEKFPQIEDRDVISNLASAIKDQAANVAADAKGQKTVSLDRAKVLEILAPTGMTDLDPAGAEKIVQQLQ